jgi:hypothetical protein
MKMNSIYPESKTLDSFEMEGYTLEKEYMKNGAKWFVYKDPEGKLWKAPSQGSPVFLTPYTDEG